MTDYEDHLIAERERIADWLEERAKLLADRDHPGALELAVSASAIRANKLGPNGMHADEPILQRLQREAIEERDGGHGDDR